MSLKRQIITLCGIILIVEGTRKCPDLTKAHLTRCDRYFKCVTLPSNNIVWIPQNCPNGLIYDSNYKTCVLPGNDWECQLDDYDKSSSSADDDNVYGVNNLSYLRKQIKGYEADSNRIKSEEEELEDEEGEVQENELHDDGFMITLTSGHRKNESEKIELGSNTVNITTNDFESSGDGDDENLEDKIAFAPIPINSDPSGVVTSQLQRLSQLIKKVNSEQNPSNDLAPDDLNQFLALHKISFDYGQNNHLSNAEPVPHNGVIDENHLEQILDLQKKINNFVVAHDTYSTPATPLNFAISGNGAYPADATTVHIKATNALKNPRFPTVGHSTSQIVVNRPEGSVIFSLPHPQQQLTRKPDRKPEEAQISENTLKMLLELSKQMTNQAPNTPNFVHSPPPPPSNGYAQPVIQPILYNFPWNEISFASLLSALDTKKTNSYQDETQSMEKMASVSGVVPTTANAASEPDDKGQSTIIHNHIPITIAHPNPTNSIINRIHSISSTVRPNHYDSYGQQKPAEDSNNYISYPPIQGNRPNYQQLSPVSTAVTSYSSAYPSFNNPNIEQQPQYIQISQSRPDSPYISSYTSNNNDAQILNNIQSPIPTYASIDGGYTKKIYTPQPHLNDNNVNDFVRVERKPFPTLHPVNYVPIGSDSSPNANYADPPPPPPSSPINYDHHSHKFTITDKVDHFMDPAESGEGEAQQPSSDYGESDENDDSNEYTNPNIEQNSNENVMNLLANYNSQIKPNRISARPAEKNPIHQYRPKPNENHKQFVNLNGNFMSMETYQQSIEPYLPSNSLLGSQIEILTCATGVRQANSSDCTRYFVCNAKTGKILSYSCPMYTAFNADTKICNAETYSRCHPDAIKTKTASISKHTRQQIQQSLIEANRIKAEALEAQKLAHLIQLETDKILNQNKQMKLSNRNGAKATSMPPTPTRPSNVYRPHRKPQHKITVNRATRPTVAPQRKPIRTSSQSPVKKIQGKRKIPCKTEGKLSDNLSQFHYFLCFKDPTGTMRARRLQCPANLIFCAGTSICTQTARCMNKFNRL